MERLRAGLVKVVATRRVVYIGTPHVRYELTLTWEGAEKFEAALNSSTGQQNAPVAEGDAP